MLSSGLLYCVIIGVSLDIKGGSSRETYIESVNEAHTRGRHIDEELIRLRSRLRDLGDFDLSQSLTEIFDQNSMHAGSMVEKR
jgi:hypothetical protein